MLKVLMTIGIIGITIVVLALVTDVRLFQTDEVQEQENTKVIEDNSATTESLDVIESEHELRDSIVMLAKKHLGTPYVYACAIEGKGFDCSGFTYFVFKEFDIEIPRSSSEIAKAGTPIPYNQAAKGDIVVFTGTDKSLREPGHVGIVIENNGEGIKFIHSSSGDNNVGVIISEVEGTNYEDRFLEVRRVINES